MTNYEELCEAMKVLARFKNKDCKDAILLVLSEFLFHEDRWVRDGAMLALDILEDQRSIPALERAIAVETVPDLKKDMMLCLDDWKRHYAEDKEKQQRSSRVSMLRNMTPEEIAALGHDLTIADSRRSVELNNALCDALLRGKTNANR